MTQSIDRGLELSSPDRTTLEEWERFRQYERRSTHGQLPAWELWGELRADVLKRYRMQSLQFMTDGSFATPLTFLHYYAIVGFDAGALYEIEGARAAGYSRRHIVDTLAIAFLHAPSMGLHNMAPAIRERLRTYRDPEGPAPWPAGWRADPEALSRGLDFSTPDLSGIELGRLRRWYVEKTGEVPGHVELLGRLRPRLLKMNRNRFENAIKGDLPNQMLGYLQVHFEVMRGHADGIRDAVLLARGLGMSLTHTVDAILWGMLYGGTGAMTNVERAVGDLLRE